MTTAELGLLTTAAVGIAAAGGPYVIARLNRDHERAMVLNEAPQRVPGTRRIPRDTARSAICSRGRRVRRLRALELVALREGDTVATVTTNDVLTEFPAELRNQLVQTVAGRMSEPSS